MFEEGLEVLLKGLSQERLSHDGTWYHVTDMPLEMHPVQKPVPQLWYGGGDERGATLAARYGMHFVTLGPNERVANVLATYRAAWDELKGAPERKWSVAPAPLAGVGRHIVIAETDAAAEKIARPAYDYWFDSVTALWRAHGAQPVTGMMIPGYDEAKRVGQIVAGSAKTVKAALLAQAEAIPLNYLVCQFAFGCQTHEQEMRSLDLFRSDVMPALAKL